MNYKNDAMKHALSKRRGHGLDVNIIISKDEKPSDDLAPEVKDAGDPQDPNEPAELSAGDKSSFDSQMLGGMSDYDKQDLQGRDPRSLGERARKAALERSKA